MRIAPLLVVLFTLAFGSVVYGQAADGGSPQAVDPTVRELVEMLRKMQPPEWPYSKLAAESDLIVIAKVTDRVEVEWDEAIAGEFDETVVQCFSKLQVLSTFKGRAEDEIDVVTVEWKRDVVVLTPSDFANLRRTLLVPNLVGIEIDGDVTGYGGSNPIETSEIEPEYLLYLRKIRDTTYVPVTGQKYSRMSVRVLNN